MSDPSALLAPDGPGPVLHWGLAALGLALGMSRVVIDLKRNQDEAAAQSDWRWGAFIFLILLAGRWPWILDPHELNTDESQMIAGAHSLVSHPVFWRTVDGSTSGPMNFFAVIPLGAVTGWEGFFHTRILAWLLLGVALCGLYYGMARLHGRTAARLAVLPALAIEGLSRSVDFQHYSTELLPLALMGTAFHLMLRGHVRGLSPLATGAGGVLLGLVPLAKLQAVPLAAMQGAVWIALLLLAWRRRAPQSVARLAYLGAGALLPAAAFALQVGIAGEWDNMLKTYVLANRYYVEIGGVQDSTKFHLVLTLLREGLPAAESLRLMAVGLVLGALFSVRRLLRAPAPCLLALAATLVAAVSVALPGRDYPHYLQLMILPLTWLAATLLDPLLQDRAKPWPKRAFAFAIPLYVVTVLGTRITPQALPFALGNTLTSAQAFARQVGEHIRPDEKLAVWGWSSYVYVDTRTTQATRRAMSQLMFEPGPLRLHFRRQYLEDLMRSEPVVFVDSTGPMSLYYHNPALRHEAQFPALAAYIAAHYTLVGEYRRARIYRRNEAAAAANSP